MSNLVKRMDIQGAKATLAATLWMPRAFRLHLESRAVPSARSTSSPRGIALVLIALVVATMVFWSTPADAQEVTTPKDSEPLWSADMFVVEYTSISIGAASADLFSNIGGSGDLKIKSLWSHVPSRDIRLAFQEGVSDADDLTLIVGELTLEFPPGSSGNKQLQVDRRRR